MADKKFETLDGINSSGDVTISGNLTVDTDTLFVNSTNNRVGIGTSSPTQLLDVDGTVKATTFTGTFSGDGSGLTNVDAELLDSLDSTQFLRSDANDQFTASELLFNGTQVTINNNSSGFIRLWNDIPLRFGSVDTPGTTMRFTSNNLEIRGNTGKGSNVNFAANTLFIDTSNVHVGIGRSDPRDLLDVSGRALANTFTSNLQTVSPASTVTLNFTTNANFEITMNQNIALVFTVDSLSRGQSGMIILNQDANGGRTFSLPAIAKTPVGGASIAQQTQPNSTSIINYFVANTSSVLINYIGNFQ